jgi:hypothetical protein
MDRGRIVGQLKVFVPVVGLIGLLGAGPLSEPLKEPMRGPLNVSTNSEGEELATFLEDFEFIPGSAVTIEGQYVLALYGSSKRQLFALALLTADQDPEYCTLMEAVAFSLVDAQGEDAQMARASNDSHERFRVVINSRQFRLSAEPVSVDAHRSIVSGHHSDQIESEFAV